MRRTITGMIIIISSCVIVPCYGMMQGGGISVIEPGIGLGNIKLDDSLSDVLSRMDRKKPSSGKTVRSGNRVEYWLSYEDMGITFIFNENERLERIAVSNPGIVLQNSDIRANSSLRDMERVYGLGNSRKLNEKYELRMYSSLGISFTINRLTERIETITIEKRKTRKEVVPSFR